VPAEQAIICILMLRGPQTMSELISRTERMIHDNENALLDALDSLMHRDIPLVEQLERQSGQREDRYGQLVFDQGELSAMSVPSMTSTKTSTVDDERIDILEQEVATLKAQLKKVVNELNIDL